MKKHIENTIENPVTANSVRDNNDDNIIDGGVYYWVTGHSMGAGVANLVAASLVSSEKIPEISGIGGNSDNVYCYTFAAPNTFYKTDNRYIRDSHAIPGKNVTGDYREPKGVKYRCIFNIVNDDDFVPKLPMEDCNWTKYGRDAVLSINNLIHTKNALKLLTYNYKRRHEFDEYLMTSLITNNERFLYSIYRGNKDAVEDIIKEFSNIYINDKKNMRNDTYKHNSNYVYYENVSFDSIVRRIAGYNKYAQPYLKIESDGHRIKLVQMPAYFMQVVAGGMHSNNNDGETRVSPLLNKAQIKYTQLAKRYEAARDKLVKNKDNIESPHYLESYYNLIKEVNITDFR